MPTRNRRPILERALALLALSLTPWPKPRSPSPAGSSSSIRPSASSSYATTTTRTSANTSSRPRTPLGDTAASAEAEALHDDAGRDTLLFDEVLSEWGEEDDFSVDGRAERFIEKFYEEKRIERQESLLQYKEMLQKIC
uniref:Uncharacterized protein n=1 Tax=Ananas comosus var. bracteatus TaxID=296719 RepID=A0A6V7QGS5_ANACO|nr:unnamed protein product [Ananas comosus var. bracteatus]